MVARLGAALECFLVPSEAGCCLPRARALPFECVALKNGDLCGLCSRDLPLDRRLLFVAELTGQMVGCVGNAPTRPSQGHPLYRRLAVFTRLTTLEWLRGRDSNPRLAAYETAALPLGDPAVFQWHGVSVPPRARKVLGTSLRKLAPAVPIVILKNWCGKPDLHRHRLIGTQASCSWTMTANKRRGLHLCAPAPRRQKRTNTAANSDLSSHPQDCFTADLSVFQAHLPVHD